MTRWWSTTVLQLRLLKMCFNVLVLLLLPINGKKLQLIKNVEKTHFNLSYFCRCRGSLLHQHKTTKLSRWKLGRSWGSAIFGNPKRLTAKRFPWIPRRTRRIMVNYKFYYFCVLQNIKKLKHSSDEVHLITIRRGAFKPPAPSHS